jgi:hypothetical protein
VLVLVNNEMKTRRMRGDAVGREIPFRRCWACAKGGKGFLALLRRIVALIVTLVALTASSGTCGPLLDEILNCLKLDAHTKARDEARVCGVEPGKAVGQTFVTGDGVEQVFRIAVWQPLSLHGVRVRSGALDGQSLFAQDRVSERVDVLF